MASEEKDGEYVVVETETGNEGGPGWGAILIGALIGVVVGGGLAFAQPGKIYPRTFTSTF